MTLGDLVALVAGSGLAAGLAWYSGWGSLRTLAGRPAPDWYLVLLYVIEVCRKGCLALVPVILARKARYGGPVRPGEFAALCVGLDLLLLAASQWPALGIVYHDPDKKDRLLVNMGAFWIWNGATLAASVVAAVVLATRHRRLPGWAAALLLFAAWYGLNTPVQVFYREGLNALLAGAWQRLPRITVVALDQFLSGLPFGILWFLPNAFAGLDALRPRAGRTWIERAGFTLALATWVFANANNLLRPRLNNPGLRSPGIDAIHGAILVLTLVLALVLARRLAPTLRRWLGLT